MPPAAVPVTLTASKRKTLKTRVRGAKTPWRDRLRAQVVLLAARGRPNARIAAELRASDDTVRKWRGRFAALGLSGLEDLPRSGWPRRISEADRTAVMIHTPVHASWLNQVEIFFSVIQKKVVSPNDFPSLEKLSETLLAFIDRYNRTAARSAGSTPPLTSGNCSAASASTRRTPQQARPASQQQPDPRRTCGPNHLSQRYCG
jgi:hypothetical protein